MKIVDNIPTWWYPKPSWKYPLVDGERRNYRIKERPLPCDFAEKNLYFPQRAYTFSGNFKPQKWQVEPINSVYYNQFTCFCGPVQTGKTMMAELGAYWGMSELGVRGMLGFSVDEKAEEMFIDRYREMIMCEKNKVLFDLWDGKEDSLSKNKIRLKNCVWTSASANGKNSFASTTAPFTIGSEVAKWNIKGYDPVQMLRGRSDSAFGLFDSRKMILESSPFEEGDLLYQQFFREGSCILQPHYKCPHCGTWQTLTDSQIILKDESLKNRPAKIRELKDASCFYECFFCGNEIAQRERVAMSENPIWAMAEIEEHGFKQKAEKIEPDGSIAGRLPGGVRKGYDIICYWWNRLVDISFPFPENLARFFETVRDDSRKRTYENETMARWWKRKTGRIEEKYLETRKLEGYYQWGDKHVLPDWVILLTLGIDTQDDGFYYSFVGWGAWLNWLVARHGFIPCPRLDKGYEYQVYEKVMANLYFQPIKWADGSTADFISGAIDRGGHRAEDVDFICKHFPGQKLHAYHGLTQRHEDRDMVYKSEKDYFYTGQSDALSEDCGKYISSENFHLPIDVEPEFIKQIGRQFHQKKISADGTVKTQWVHNYMGADHYRDTLNLNLAAAKIKSIDKMLLNAQYCETIKQNRSRLCIPEKRVSQQQSQSPRSRYVPTSYFRNLGGRGR